MPAWTKELADATTSVHELEDELRYHLEKDVTILDDPLRDGSRLGVGTIDPAGHARYIEGRQLYGLFRRIEEQILLSKETVLEFARRHGLRPPSGWSDGQVKLKPAPDRSVIEAITQPSRSHVLKQAPDWIVIEKIRRAYNPAKNEGRKPPNINELPAAVQPFLQERGFSASGRQIKRLGEMEEFKRLRRRPGKTLASERQK